MVHNQTIQNEYEWVIRGELDITAGAAVSAIRGTNMTATKNGTGTYDIVVKGTSALKLVELLGRNVGFAGTVPATATGCRVSSVTQNSSTDDITITLKTSLNPSTGADTDTTAATTLSFQVVIRVGKMGNPL